MHFLAEQEHTNTEVAQTCTPALQQRKRRQTMAVLAMDMRCSKANSEAPLQSRRSYDCEGKVP
jgi:hypothetical protein